METKITGAPFLMPMDGVRKTQGFNNFKAKHNLYVVGITYDYI